jgi:DNA-binding transcriptional regulator GbsR (MarR family)
VALRPEEPMRDPVEEFVEKMGLMMEAEGLPRIAGRLIGFLLLHDGAFSLDDLAERLQVSKASVSTNARLLEHAEIIERIGSPGDRRDYYRMGVGAWERTLRAAQRRWRALTAMFEEAAASLPPEMQAGKRRLEEANRFHSLMIEGVDRLLDEWRESAGVGSGELPKGSG